MQFFLKSTEASDPTRLVGPLEPGLDARLRGLSARQHRILLHSAFIGILALYVLLRLWRLHAYSLWYDEVFSVLVARSTWKELLWQVLLDRVHPPMFYALLKLWVGAFGDGLGPLRLFSVFFSTVAIVPLWSCTKRIGLSRQLSLVLLLAIACNPFLIFYSQEVRMYALLGFLSIWSVDLYLKQEEKGSSRSPLLALVNLSLVLVHVAGAAVVGFELLHSMVTEGKLRNRALQLALPAFGALLLWFIAIRLLVPCQRRGSQRIVDSTAECHDRVEGFSSLARRTNGRARTQFPNCDRALAEPFSSQRPHATPAIAVDCHDRRCFRLQPHHSPRVAGTLSHHLSASLLFAGR